MILNNISGKEYVARYKLIEQIARNLQIDMRYKDDFIAEMYLTLCEQDDELIDKLVENGQIRFWLSRVCISNWKSKTSRFFYKYKKNWDNRISRNGSDLRKTKIDD